MKLYVGVDGGQTSTLAVIGDERGAMLGRGVGPPADLVGEARGGARQAEAIDAAVADAVRDAGLSERVEFAAVVCGISGYAEGEAIPCLSVRAHRLRIVHDSENALAGALGCEPGIVVIAGTGSVALGVDEWGRRVGAGGWGFLFGDEGSAFWIARRALSLAMRREDHGEMARLGVEALAFFEKSSFHGIRSAFAHNELTRPTVASFASRVFALAVGGDVDAQLIRADAARALAELVFCVDLRMGKPEKIHVSYAGGVFGDKRLRELWSAAVSERVPRAVVAEPLGDPVAGALRLAYKEAGCESIPF